MNWLFEDSGQLKVARQVSEAPASLQLELGSGRRLKVKRSQCLLAFSEHDLEAFFLQAQDKAKELDPDFLWQCAPAEEFAFLDFAKEVYGTEGSNPLDQASLLLALQAAPVYFQRKGKGLFRAMPEESLKAALAGIEKRRLATERQAQMKQELVDGQLPEPLALLGISLFIRPDKQSVEYKALEQAAFECQTSIEQLALQR
ncbi:MAG: RNB domain-containing ribonuclease, partial [Burkholderiaceae bacterium]